MYERTRCSAEGSLPAGLIDHDEAFISEAAVSSAARSCQSPDSAGNFTRRGVFRSHRPSAWCGLGTPWKEETRR